MALAVQNLGFYCTPEATPVQFSLPPSVAMMASALSMTEDIEREREKKKQHIMVCSAGHAQSGGNNLPMHADAGTTGGALALQCSAEPRKESLATVPFLNKRTPAAFCRGGAEQQQ
jgi:hypothetical protein